MTVATRTEVCDRPLFIGGTWRPGGAPDWLDVLNTADARVVRRPAAATPAALPTRHGVAQDSVRLADGAHVVLDPESVAGLWAAAGLDGTSIGRGDDVEHRLFVLGDVFQVLPHQRVAAPHPGLEIDVRILLVEDREAVADADVVGQEARLRPGRNPPGLGILDVDEVAVGHGEHAVVLEQASLDGRGEGQGRVFDDRAVGVVVEAPCVRNGFLVIRAVVCVGVEEEQRIPALQHVLHQPPGLGRLELHALTVQIEILAVLTLSHALRRAVLVAAIVAADLLVAVGV